MFAIGRPRQIVYFHSLLDRLWFYSRSVLFNPEFLMTRHIRDAAMQLGEFKAFTMTDLPYFVFRPHMADWSAERLLAEGPTASKWHDPEVVAARRDYHQAK